MRAHEGFTGNLGRLYGDPRLSNQDVRALIDQADQRGNAAGFAGLPEDVGNLGRTAASGVAPDVWAIYQGLVNVIQSGSRKDVAAYVEANRRDLNDMVSMRMLPQDQADFITNTLLSFAPLSEPVLAPDSEPSWIGPKPPRPSGLGDPVSERSRFDRPDGIEEYTSQESMPGYTPQESVPPGMQNPFGDWLKAEPFQFPINPSTGLPWTGEERGPMRRVPRSGGINPETGESYPGRGYYTGDESGMHGKTLEYVPTRDVLPEGFLRNRGMRHGGIMSLRRR